jgi:hypothetical protein
VDGELQIFFWVGGCGVVVVEGCGEIKREPFLGLKFDWVFFFWVGEILAS